MKKKRDDEELEVTHLQPWWWRTRYKMAPFYAAISIILVGMSLKYLESITQVVMLTGTVVFLLVILVRARFATGKKKDPGMAFFLYTVIAVYFGLVLVIRFNVLPVGWLMITLTASLVILGLFWWFDRRNLKTQELELEMARWPDLAKKIGLAKVRRTATRITETGRRTRLWWNPGDATFDGVQSHARQLEGALGIPVKKIRFEPVLDEDGNTNPNMIDVSENTQAKSTKAPVPFDRPTMTTVYDRMFIGPLENAEDYDVIWYDRKWGGKHTLVAGQTGSGKSGLYDLVFAESIFCMDLIKWGVDPKGGMTLLPWAPTFDWLVTDNKGAESMLTAVKDVLEARSAYAGSRGWKVWRCSAKNPLLLVIIDECAEVLGPYNGVAELANSIARMGRAAGVLLLLATQYPTNEAISSSQLTKNLGRRFCFSVLDSLAQRVILPGSTEVVDATSIPLGPKHAGTFYTSEGGVLNTLSGRVRFVSDEKIRELVIEVGDAVAKLDRLSVDAATKATEKFKAEAYSERRHYLVEDLPDLDDGDGDDEEAGMDEDTDDDEEATAVPMTKASDGRDPDDVDIEYAMAGDMPPEPTPERRIPPVPGRGLPSMGLSIAELADSIDPAERDRAIAEYLLEQQETNISPQEAQRRFDAALDAAGPDGITPKQLKAISGRQKTWVYDELERQMIAETVIQASKGHYRRPPGRIPRSSGDAS